VHRRGLPGLRQLAVGRVQPPQLELPVAETAGDFVVEGSLNSDRAQPAVVEWQREVAKAARLGGDDLPPRAQLLVERDDADARRRDGWPLLERALEHDPLGHLTVGDAEAGGADAGVAVLARVALVDVALQPQVDRLEDARRQNARRQNACDHQRWRAKIRQQRHRLTPRRKATPRRRQRRRRRALRRRRTAGG